jgi:hypothetical protein
MNEMIPSNVMKYFNENPNIGRYELSKLANITESDARFYCKLFKNKKTDVKIVKKGIAAWDLHYPYHSEESFSCLLQVIEYFKPDIFILGGDNMDFDMISAYNYRKPKLLENRRIGKEYAHFYNDILQSLNTLLSPNCDKYFMYGNHEERVDRLVEAEPKLEGLVEITKNINLDSWKILKYKEVLTIGHMNFIHGLYWNKYHAHKTVTIYEKNIFYGHVHSPQSFTTVSPIDSLPKQGVSVGCMCEVNPEYRKDEPNHWVNQFLIFYLLSDGTFRYETPTIIHGRTIVNGKLFDGNRVEQ